MYTLISVEGNIVGKAETHEDILELARVFAEQREGAVLTFTQEGDLTDEEALAFANKGLRNLLDQIHARRKE